MSIFSRSRPVEDGVAPREHRDPTAATRLINYSAPGLPLPMTWDAESAIRQLYLQSSVVYACANVIAKAVAKCPIRAGEPPSHGKKGQINPESRLGTLLGPPGAKPVGMPNPQWSSRRMIKYAVLGAVVPGRFAWELELDKNTGQPLRLWPLATTRITPIPNDGGGDYWRGFQYNIGRQRITLSPDQVFYWWNPSADNPLQAESGLQAGRLDSQAAIMMDRADLGFYRNGMRGSKAIIYPAFGDDEAEDAFQRQFIAQHTGPDNAGKTVFMEGQWMEGQGIKGQMEVVDLSTSQKDASFIESYRQKITGTCMSMGVPLSMLNAADRTFSNGDVEVRNFWEITVFDLLDDLASDINGRLAPRFGSDVIWFETDHIDALRPPSRFQQLNPVELRDAGIITDGEIRTEMGLSEEKPDALANAGALDEEDEGGASVETTTVDRAALAAQTLIALGFDPAEVLNAVGLPPMTYTPKAEPAPILPLPTAMASALEQRADDALAERRTRTIATVTAHMDALEAAWRSAFRSLFSRQEKHVLSRLTGKSGRRALRAEGDTPNVDEVFDPAYWTGETVDSVVVLLESLVGTNGARLASEYGIDFSLEAPHVDRFIRERANQLAGGVTDTTYAGIKQAMSEGVSAGEGIDGIADRVRGAFSQASDQRARTIARTEVVGAYNGSTDAVAGELPADVVAGQEWLAVHDGRTREAHADADGQVRARGEAFSVGGEELRYPGDGSGSAENIINCRCVLGLLTPAEYAARQRASVAVIHVEDVFRRMAAGTLDLPAALMEITA